MSHIISHIKEPKPYHEGHNGVRLRLPSVPEQPADVRRESDDEHGGDDGGSSDNDEGSPATELAVAAIAHEAGKRLHEESGERAAEPYHAGPRVRDPELLHVRRK